MTEYEFTGFNGRLAPPPGVAPAPEPAWTVQDAIRRQRRHAMWAAADRDSKMRRNLDASMRKAIDEFKASR